MTPHEKEDMVIDGCFSCIALLLVLTFAVLFIIPALLVGLKP